jgi:hypothetical protein
LPSIGIQFTGEAENIENVTDQALAMVYHYNHDWQAFPKRQWFHSFGDDIQGIGLERMK